MTRITLPAFLEIEPGRFLGSDDATLGQWRAACKIATAPEIVRQIARMIRLADAYGLSDDAPLLPQIAHTVRAPKH